MRNSISLSIPKPCAERWSNFSITSRGGFCGACSKTVVDFTTLSDAEIRNFFSKKPEHTCGRFLSSQLKAYSHPALALRPGLGLLRAGIVGMMLVFTTHLASAQQTPPKQATATEQNSVKILRDADEKFEVFVKGIVKEFSGTPLPGTNIYIDGTTQGTVSDNNGRFEFPKKLHKGDVLVFSFIGFETMKYVVGSTTSDLDIEMKFNDAELIMMGDVAVDGPQGSPRAIKRIWNRVKRLL